MADPQTAGWEPAGAARPASSPAVLGVPLDPYAAAGVARPVTSMPAQAQTSLGEDVTSMLPVAGAMAGSLLGPPGVGAGIGGIIGEQLRQSANAIMGIKSTSGPSELLKAGAGQAALDVGAGLATKAAQKILAPMAKRVANPAIAEIIDTAKQFGMKLTPAQATQSQFLRAIEFAGMATAPGRAVAAPRQLETWRAAADATRSVLDTVSGISSNMGTGQGLQEIANAVPSNFAAQAKALYDVADQAAGSAKVVDTQPLVDLAKKFEKRSPELRAAFPATTKPSAELTNLLQDYIPQNPKMTLGGQPLTPEMQAKLAAAYPPPPPPMLSIGDAHQLRSDLLDWARNSGSADTAVFAKQAQGVIRDQMMAAAKGIGPDVADSITTADEFYRNGKQLIQSAVFKKLAKEDPEKLVAMIQPNAVTDLTQLKATLKQGGGTDAFPAFQRQWVQNQLKSPEGTFGPDELAKLSETVGKWNPDFRKEMFPDVRSQIALRNLEKLGDVVDQLGTKAGSSFQRLHEAYQLLRMPAAIGLAATGHLQGAALGYGASYLLPAVLMKTMENPVAAKWLTEGLAQIPKDSGKAVVNIGRGIDLALKGTKAITAAAGSND